jgi:hypothetical protein
VTALSLPEFTILKKVMKTKLIIIFAGVVGAGIIITGYMFNYLLSPNSTTVKNITHKEKSASNILK